jgi:hypothetical protein
MATERVGGINRAWPIAQTWLSDKHACIGHHFFGRQPLLSFPAFGKLIWADSIGRWIRRLGDRIYRRLHYWELELLCWVCCLLTSILSDLVERRFGRLK